MRRRGWPGWVSTLVLILLVYAVLLVMIASIVVSIARLATEMPQYANQAQHDATAATDLLTKFGVGPEQLHKLADQLNWGKIAQFVGSLLDGISGVATSIVFLLALLLFLSVETTGVAWRLTAVGVRPAGVRGAVPVRRGNPDVPRGDHGLRADRRSTRHGGTVDHRRSVGDHLGPAVVHHQLRPQYRVHPGTDPTRSARTRQWWLADRAGRDRRLLRAEPDRASRSSSRASSGTRSGCR